jgi:hypothetical protein
VSEELRESTTGRSEISGFGDNVVKITDAHGKTVCFIGRTTNEPKELVHFPSPVPVEVIAGVQTLLEKRKMRKALDNGNFDKAQKFADRKWGEVYSG